MTPKEDTDWVDDDDSSSSSQDHSEHEEESDTESDVDEQDDNWWKDLVVGAWKQHAVAVLVALLAAIYTHGKFSVSKEALHDVVSSYNRTDGIQFCPRISNLEMDESSRMEPMDFRVPLELMDVMEQHYAMDYLQDKEDAPPTAEYYCMKELETMTTQSFIKGYTQAYMSPSISDIYPNAQTPKQLATLSFTGFAAKFINLSPDPILLHWDGTGGHKDSSRLVAEIAPFEAVGTATTPGQSFFVSPILDATHALQRWVLTADSALVVYQPSVDTNKLDSSLLQKYRMQLLNLAFAKDYLVKTGRTWLAAFPRPKPVHYMHDAQYMGQRHEVVTFDNKKLTMEVVAVMPRVFVIEDFLSVKETEELIQLGRQDGLRASTVHSGDAHRAVSDVKTRSSTNTWLEREASTTVDAVYQRAADLLHLDESLLRHQSRLHNSVATHHSIAESLQLVRYQKGQEYTPHHDFVYPSISNRYQPTRFATLLMYLNHDGLEGGETVFPRALNAEYHDGIKVTPETGRAVLFYSVLPDGNVDDTSQHGSKPVTKGDKWIANLWVWDPIID